MKRLVSFFEIPAVDFTRTVKFYEELFGITMEVMDCGHEMMAFFPGEDGCQGAVSWSSEFDFKPSAQGVLVSLRVDDMATALERVEAGGGKILIPKTKIEAEGLGWFAVILDCEGNRVGLQSDN